MSHLSYLASDGACSRLFTVFASRVFVALLTLGCGVAGHSEESTSHYIYAGQLLDVNSGKWLPERLLKVDNGRIIEVAAKVEKPGVSPDIDLGEYYVLPGLIDMHVHLTSSPNVHGYRRLSRSTPRAAIYGVTAARETVMAGFTTVRNLGAPGFADVALRDAINEGEVIGPRMRVAGRMICITGGHCDGALLAPSFGVESETAANGPWEVKAAVRKNIKYGADVIKFAASGGVLSAGTDVNASQFSLEEMKALVAEAHDRGRTVTAHAHGRNGILRAIEAGVDSIEHASLIDKKGIRMAKANGTYLVMDVYVSDYILSEGEAAGILPASLLKEKQVGRLQRENFREAHRHGVKIAFGSDAGVFPHGQNGRQFAHMVEWGMTELEAIRAATLSAATLLNWRDSEGRLNVGHAGEGAYADLIAVPRNPLDDIRVLEAVPVVVKGGQLIKSEQGG